MEDLLEAATEPTESIAAGSVAVDKVKIETTHYLRMDANHEHSGSSLEAIRQNQLAA